MLSTILYLTSKSTQSYNMYLNLRSVHLVIGYEWLIFTVGFITAIVAIMAFRASTKQSQLTTVPHLTIEVRGTVANNSKLVLVNHNRRFAFNMKFEPVSTYLKDVNRIDKYTLEINTKKVSRNYISESDCETELTILESGEIMDQDFGTFIIAYNRSYRRGLILKFTDSQNIRYFTRLDFDKGKTLIRQAPKRLTIFQRLVLSVVSTPDNVKLLSYRFRMHVINIKKKLESKN